MVSWVLIPRCAAADGMVSGGEARTLGPKKQLGAAGVCRSSHSRRQGQRQGRGGRAGIDFFSRSTFILRAGVPVVHVRHYVMPRHAAY